MNGKLDQTNKTFKNVFAKLSVDPVEIHLLEKKRLQ